MGAETQGCDAGCTSGKPESTNTGCGDAHLSELTIQKSSVRQVLRSSQAIARIDKSLAFPVEALNLTCLIEEVL